MKCIPKSLKEFITPWDGTVVESEEMSIITEVVKEKYPSDGLLRALSQAELSKWIGKWGRKKNG